MQQIKKIGRSEVYGKPPDQAMTQSEINKSRQRRRPQIVGGGAARPAHGSSGEMFYPTQPAKILLNLLNFSIKQPLSDGFNMTVIKILS